MTKPQSGMASLLIYCLLILYRIIIPADICNADTLCRITINNISTGVINRKIFGNNIVAYDPASYGENQISPFNGYSDFGGGLWNPKRQMPMKEVVLLAQDAGIQVLRYPGGCGAHNYDWKKTIGKGRKKFLFGLDEFLEVANEIHAEVVLTLSDFTGTEQDAADLVEYLNSLDDGNHKWAKERSKNGRKEPYNIRYFEIGNETYHGNHRDIKGISADEYAQKYLKYYDSMKAIDPDVKIGAVFYTADWNKRVLSILGDKIDFGIVHIYPSSPLDGRKEKTSGSDLFKRISSALKQEENNIQNTLGLIKQISKKDVPLAITEYNIGLIQEKPVPYRFSLGAALVNADLLRIFLDPSNNILMANYWNFVNEYWGMIANGFYEKPQGLYAPYYKRPVYYVFELYNKHFGDILVDAEMQNKIYEIQGKEVQYLSINASKSADGEKVYLMVINKNMDAPVTSTIELEGFVPAAEGNAWILNGPSIDATNEKKHDNVRVKHIKFSTQSPEPRAQGQFEYTFEPHSLTAIEIEKSQ